MIFFDDLQEKLSEAHCIQYTNDTVVFVAHQDAETIIENTLLSIILFSQQDDTRLYDYNVKERVDKFVEVTCEQAEHYKTNHIILTMGSDFQYENALRWFINLDKLIKYVNEV